MSDLTHGWEPSARDKAGLQVRQLVPTVAGLIEGEDVTITRTTEWGSTYQDVEPLAGLRAAVFIEQVARGRVREYAIAARAAGASWTTVGAALGIGEIVERTGRDLAEAAWFRVVDGVEPTEEQPLGGWSDTLGWTCTSCGERVRDQGPFDSHPHDREDGHAENCARQAGELRTWRRHWDDDLADLDEKVDAEADTNENAALGGVSGRW